MKKEKDKEVWKRSGKILLLEKSQVSIFKILKCLTVTFLQDALWLPIANHRLKWIHLLFFLIKHSH